MSAEGFCKAKLAAHPYAEVEAEAEGVSKFLSTHTCSLALVEYILD